MHNPKPLKERSKRTLELLKQAGRVSDLSKETGWSYESARAILREMKQAGYLDELGDGLYQTNKSGQQRLKVRKGKGGILPGMQLTQPPKIIKQGRKLTQGAKDWLERNYPLFGHVRCAEALGYTGNKAKVVWSWGKKLGLEYGSVDGYLLLTEVVKLMDGNHHRYTQLWSKAKRAGVLRYPPGSKGRQTQRKAMVPIEWLEATNDEYTPAENGLMRLKSVLLVLERRGITVGKTSLTRSVARLSIETVTRKPAFGPPALFVSTVDYNRLIEYLANRPEQKNTGGQAKILELLNQAGQLGLTEKELEGLMGCSRAAVRFALAKLGEKGKVNVFQRGNTFYPNIYRTIGHCDPPAYLPERYAATPLSWVSTLEAIRKGASTKPVLRLALNQTDAVVNNYLHDLIRWGIVKSEKLEGNRKSYKPIYALPPAKSSALS
jgi:hypothetical protein